MFGKDNKKPQSRIDSLIGAGTEIEGNISFSGGLRVDGHVRGNITSEGDHPGMLVISEQAFWGHFPFITAIIPIMRVITRPIPLLRPMGTTGAVADAVADPRGTAVTGIT